VNLAAASLGPLVSGVQQYLRGRRLVGVRFEWVARRRRCHGPRHVVRLGWRRRGGRRSGGSLAVRRRRCTQSNVGGALCTGRHMDRMTARWCWNGRWCPPQRRSHTTGCETHLVAVACSPAVGRVAILHPTATTGRAISCEPHERVAWSATQRIAKARVGAVRRAIDHARPTHTAGQRKHEKGGGQGSHGKRRKIGALAVGIDLPIAST